MTPRAIFRCSCLVPLAACATTQSLRTTDLGAGTARVYPDSLGRVVEAASRAVPIAGLKLASVEHRDSQMVMIIATKGMSFVSYGEMVRLVLQPQSEGGTAARVHTVPRLGTNFLYKRWDDDVFGALGRELARAASQDAAAGLPLRWAPVVEALRSLQPGTGVRVALHGGRRESGGATDVSDSTLGLGSRAPVRAVAIDSLWVRRTRARTGFVVGSLVGAVAGLVLELRHNRDCPYGSNSCLTDGLLIGLGVALGAGGAGALVGSGIANWKLRFP